MSEEKNNKESFVFYRSFYTSFKQLSDEQAGRMFKCVVEYALDNVEPKLDGVEGALFELVRPQIDASARRYERASSQKKHGIKGKEHGKKGGRPKKLNLKEKGEKNPLNYNLNYNDNYNDNNNNKKNTKKSFFETALFDEFWELYPRKRRGNKQKAKSAYEKALKEERATEEEILQGVKNYVDSNPGDYAKGCQAWLNDDGWSHQYSPSRVTAKSENYTPVKSIYEKPNVCPNLEELFTEMNNTHFRQRGLQLGIEHLQSKENRTEEEERELNEQIATRARDQKRLQELQNDLSKLQRR